MDSLFQLIYSIVRSIPPGYVSSYGRIAVVSGNPRRSRIVGYAMSICSDPAVPCHRVVHKDGSLSPHFGAGGCLEQRALLESEGVEFLEDGRVDMKKHEWRG